MAQSGRLAAPPYVSFKTFLNFLVLLGDVGIPNRLDRSFLEQKVSGSIRPQLMSALRFLDLVDVNNRPQGKLEELAKAKELGKRSAILHEHLPKYYASVLQDINLEKASKGELEECFRTYSINGVTLRKALAFFIAAYEYSNIPLSPYISNKNKNTKKTNESRKRAQFGKKPFVEESLPQEKKAPERNVTYDIHPSIHGLLEDLENSGHKWTDKEREQWISIFTKTIEYAYPIKEKQLGMNLYKSL